ncbi:MAG: hypothetical protein AB8I69_02025 [Anaerolineae bacterium]|jgi:hypothetical protein
MVTEDGLVYVDADFGFHPLSLQVGAFPGKAQALAVDKAGQVWAINGQTVLRYDKSDRSWQHILTAMHGTDAIAADPAQGVWVAGRGELFHLGEQILHWPAPDVISPTALLVDEGRRI